MTVLALLEKGGTEWSVNFGQLGSVGSKSGELVTELTSAAGLWILPPPRQDYTPSC